MPQSENATDLLLAKRLKELEVANGGTITPDLVVDDARAEESVLHSFFEWDNEKAGHSFRLEQARRLIRSVRYEHRTEHRVISAPVYVRDPRAGNDEQGYRSIASIKTDVEMARDAAYYEFSRAHAAMARARDVAEVLGMADDVEETITSVEKLRERVMPEERRRASPAAVARQAGRG